MAAAEEARLSSCVQQDPQNGGISAGCSPHQLCLRPHVSCLFITLSCLCLRRRYRSKTWETVTNIGCQLSNMSSRFKQGGPSEWRCVKMLFCESGLIKLSGAVHTFLPISVLPREGGGQKKHVRSASFLLHTSPLF